MQKSDVLLLVGHGSPNLQGKAEFLQLTQLLTEALRIPIQPCFLESAEPSVLEAVELCIKERKATSITVLPVFLNAGIHVKKDIPAFLAEMRTEWSDVQFRYGTALGSHAALISSLVERAKEALLTTQSPFSAAETALLVVSFGGSEPDSNAEIYKIARLLWEKCAYGWVEVAFCSTQTKPDVALGIERSVRLGAKRIIVLPHLLFTGIMLQRVKEQVQKSQDHSPAVEILIGNHFQNHEGVVKTLIQRYHEALEGKTMMTCDLCKYHEDHGHHHGHHHHD